GRQYPGRPRRRPGGLHPRLSPYQGGGPGGLKRELAGAFARLREIPNTWCEASWPSRFLSRCRTRPSRQTRRQPPSPRQTARLRRSKVPLLRRNVGCVFQDFKLLPARTAAENVAYALKVQGESQASIRRKVPEVLNLVGLSHKMNSLPDELSGGEQQRVSIAR